MTNILIFGAGGVGCTYGYILHKAGCSVTAVCRSNYDKVKDRGIVIHSKMFGKCEYRPSAVRTVAEAADTRGPFDYIVVTTKSFPNTAGHIKDAVTPERTAIVLAQNGIGIEEDYVRLYPQNTIISGVVYLPVTQVEPGVVEMGPLERFEIGAFPSDASQDAKAQTQKLADIWQAGGATALVFDDVQPVRWLKLAINACWNSMCALTVCDDANLLRASPMSERMARKIMKDVARVATKAGYPDAITEATIDRDLERAKRSLAAGGKEPSMLTDVREKRPIEVEAILGNTYRIGQMHQVETPYIEMLYTLATARNYEIARDEDWKPIARHK